MRGAIALLQVRPERRSGGTPALRLTLPSEVRNLGSSTNVGSFEFGSRCLLAQHCQRLHELPASSCAWFPTTGQREINSRDWCTTRLKWCHLSPCLNPNAMHFEQVGVEIVPRGPQFRLARAHDNTWQHNPLQKKRHISRRFTFTGACSALVNAGSMRVSLPNVLMYPALCGAGAGVITSSSAPVLQYPEKTGDIQQSSFQQNLSPSCHPTKPSGRRKRRY